MPKTSENGWALGINLECLRPCLGRTRGLGLRKEALAGSPSYYSPFATRNCQAFGRSRGLRDRTGVRPLTLDPRILASFWPLYSSTWLEGGGQTETLPSLSKYDDH